MSHLKLARKRLARPYSRRVRHVRGPNPGTRQAVKYEHERLSRPADPRNK